jgi:hypothetical protein
MGSVLVMAMHLRHMWMAVLQRLVPTGMRVRLAGSIVWPVHMRVVLVVVHVRTGMLHRLVGVPVLVMQPHAKAHQALQLLGAGMLIWLSCRDVRSKCGPIRSNYPRLS